VLVRPVRRNHDDAVDQRDPAELQRSVVDAGDRVVGVTAEGIDGNLARRRHRFRGRGSRAATSPPPLQRRHAVGAGGCASPRGRADVRPLVRRD